MFKVSAGVWTLVTRSAAIIFKTIIRVEKRLLGDSHKFNVPKKEIK